MPSILTVFKWLQDPNLPDFKANYTRAREEQIAKFADELQDIADDGRNDYMTDDDGHTVINHDNIHRARLRIDTRKWILAKMLPKKYGDRVAMEHSGPDGGPIQHQMLKLEAHLELQSVEDLIKLRDSLKAPLEIPNGNGKHLENGSNGNGNGHA